MTTRQKLVVALVLALGLGYLAGSFSTGRYQIQSTTNNIIYRVNTRTGFVQSYNDRQNAWEPGQEKNTP